MNTHIDTLAEWFDSAEDGDVHEGDTFIRHLPSVGRFVVGVADEYLGANPHRRILHRAPKPKPAWHDAVAVIAHTGIRDRRVFVNALDGEWLDADTGALLGADTLQAPVPLIEAKVTDAMIDRILDVIDARFDNYPAGIGEDLAVAALGIEAE